jgi:hypothetical protein
MGSKLNIKQWALATIVIFIVMAIIEYLVHGVMLASLYQQYASYWRPEADMKALMPWMYFGYLVFAAVFVFVYARGRAAEPGVGPGARWGFYIGILLCVPAVFMQHVVFPWPREIIITWCIAGIVECTIFGIITAMMYKGDAKPA